MRRIIAIIIVAIIFSTLPLQMVQAQVGVEPPEPVVEVQRDIHIENAGIVWMTDEFALRASSEEEIEISEFWTGFHSFFTSERRSFEVWESSDWTPLTFEEEAKEGFDGYTLELPSPVRLSGDTYSSMTGELTLKIRASYLFVNMTGEGQGVFRAWIPVYPALTYNISAFDMRIEMPRDAEFDVTTSELNFTDSVQDEIWTLDHESESIPSYANENVTVSYIPAPDDDYILDCERLERKITVKQGSILVEDSYTLINTGAPKNQLHLKLPLEASDIKAKDGVGPLKVSSDEGDSELDVYVTSRWFLLNGDRMSFAVSYTMPKGDYVTTTGSVSNLAYPNNDFPFYVRELSAVVTRPESESLRFEYGALLPSERPEIESDLPPASMMPLFRPIAGFLVAAGALGALVFLRQREPRIEKKPRVEGKPGIGKPDEVVAPTLSDFIVQSRERIALIKEVESLEIELEEGEVSREEFNKRTAGINRSLGELTRSLKQLGRTLEAEDPDLAERLREIRSAEGDLDRISNDMRNLDVRLRARRISRRDYERRKKDRIRRRGQAIKKIERALESLGSGG